MTTPTTAANHLRWWQWVGPWPLRPVALGLVVTLFALATTAYLLTIDTVVRIAASAVAAGMVTGGALWLARRIAPVAVTRAPGYLSAIIIAAIAGNIVRVGTGTILDFPNLSDGANFTITVARSVMLIIIVLALLGISERRLTEQIDRGDDALAAMTKQAEALLTADEEVRRQVSLLLHDRVQAGLIAACLELRRTMSATISDDAERDARVARVVEQLEDLRILDVRQAVHALSPNLREVDLVTALDELADTYRPAMAVQISADEGIAVPHDQRLGVYRIVEQSLLNAAVHGQAETCRIHLSANGDFLAMRISDDGAGIPAVPRPGFGTTVIDTWCRVLGASWERGPASPGTQVTVHLPLVESSD